MALSLAQYLVNRDVAGPNYDYCGLVGSSRPPASYRKALREDIAARQGGICPVHGGPIAFGQFNHVFSSGPKVLGFKPGFVFIGCAVCNLDCALRFGTVTEDGKVIDGGTIPFEHFSRPDVIPSEWSAPVALKAIQKSLGL